MKFDSFGWVGVVAEHEQQTLLIRFREIPEGFPRSNYAEHLNILWEMSEPDENGPASEEETNRLEAFEDYLVDSVEYDGHSILLVVLTCNGKREFVFQTSDVPRFMSVLNNSPKELDRFPITIEKFDDPEWGYFESVIPQAS
jgi:hypothetical protein